MKLEKDIAIPNTFKVPCIADSFAHIENKEDLIELLWTEERKTAPRKLFIGSGSNILFTQERYEGLVIHNAILGKSTLSEDSNEVIVNVGWGENRDEFVRRTLEQGLCGIENLVSIPGTVGAAPIQNIGAYGVEVASLIVSVWGVNTTTGKYETMSNEQCQFWYRETIFKQKLKDVFFVTDVTFRLKKYNAETYTPNVSYGAIATELNNKWVTKPTPRDMANTIAAIRAGKLPNRKTLGTAGSFFKNVVLSKSEYETFTQKVHALHPGLEITSYDLGDEGYKIPAWRILDQVLGFRGYRQWDVGCYEKQALCLVNYGNATGPEVIQFAQFLQNECKEKLDITIEPEVNVI